MPMGDTAGTTTPTDFSYNKSGYIMQTRVGVSHTASGGKYRSTAMQFAATTANNGFFSFNYISSFADSAGMPFDPLADHTVEFWVNPDNFSATRSLMGSRNISNGNEGERLLINTSGLVQYQQANAIRLTASTPLVALEWAHVALSVSGKVARLFINGVQEGGSYLQSANSRYTSLHIGASHALSATTLSDKFRGRISELLIYKSVGIYTENFTPPGMLATDLAPYYPAALAGLTKIVEGTPPNNALSPRLMADIPSLYDVVWGGKGRIIGTVKIDADPTDTPVGRRVRLVHERSGALVRDTVSDAASGVYLFDNINIDEKYTVITYDYQNNYRAVIADNITPEPIP